MWMRAYAHFRTYEVRNTEGKSAAERTQETYGVAPPELDLGLPPELREAETVGVIYDEVDGLNFFVNFGQLEAAFASPELVADERYRQVVLEYLKEASLSPLPLRRRAERNSERASRVFRSVLKRRRFLWERDGEALLRRHKPSYFERPVLPSVTPIGGALARARLAEPAPGGSGPNRLRPGRRSNPGAGRRPGWAR